MRSSLIVFRERYGSGTLSVIPDEENQKCMKEDCGSGKVLFILDINANS